MSRHIQHRAFSENFKILRNPLRALLTAADLVQSSHTHYMLALLLPTAPPEPSLYTPLLPGLGGQLFILYVTKLIIQLLTDYRRPEIRLKYINILNIVWTERRRISFLCGYFKLSSRVSPPHILYRYRICGAPHNNVYFIGNLYRRVTCTHRALPRRRRGRGWRQCSAHGYHDPCLGHEAQLSISPETQ